MAEGPGLVACLVEVQGKSLGRSQPVIQGTGKTGEGQIREKV